ncbi:MAG TPA: YcxB family protein [Blastocatellia bacterium]|jgi:hypothetical protein
MNKLEFQYTFKEFFEGTRNAARSYLSLSVLGGVLILSTLLYLYLKNETPEGETNSLFSYLMPLLMGVLFISLPLLQAWSVWRSNPSVRGVIICWADEEGFSQQTTNSDSKIKWPALIKFRETRNLFLIYPSKQMCYLIPKRVFTNEGQVKEFRELLHQKINQRQYTATAKQR